MWNRIEDLENWCHHINMRMIGLKEGLEPGGMIKYVYNVLSEGLGIDPDAGFEIERAHHVLTLRPDANHYLPSCHFWAFYPCLPSCYLTLDCLLVILIVCCLPRLGLCLLDCGCLPPALISGLVFYSVSALPLLFFLAGVWPCTAWLFSIKLQMDPNFSDSMLQF